MTVSEIINHAENSRQKLPFTVAFIALAGLMLEIGLTRLFSVLFFPPAVFGILSLAILGIGFGAALVTWQARWCDRERVPFYLGLAAVGVVAVTAVSTISSLQIILFGLVVLP